MRVYLSNSPAEDKVMGENGKILEIAIRTVSVSVPDRLPTPCDTDSNRVEAGTGRG